MRRSGLSGLLLMLVATVPAWAAAIADRVAPLPAPLPAAVAVPIDWPAWKDFADAFVEDNGRVVDWTADARSVSEGQGYGMFFALVANDRVRFQRILDWTQANLAQDDLRTHLPAWLWGADDQRRWRVLDVNSAADADLWLAYDLLEAGRLWKRADYTGIGRAMLAQVAASEVQALRKQTVLLPGPNGFSTDDGLRLNPSYLPPFQLTYFANSGPREPWLALFDTLLALLPNIAPSGAVPDWFVLTGDGPRKDLKSDGAGSYDAVRVYLWAGITAADAPGMPRVLKALGPFADFVRKAGRLPEQWYPDGRAPVGVAAPGIEAALLPFYAALRATDLLDNAQKRLASATAAGLVGQPARYYEQALTLFGEGWVEHRYRFERDGRLHPQWLG